MTAQYATLTTASRHDGQCEGTDLSCLAVRKCSTLQAAAVNDMNFFVNQSLDKLDYFTTLFKCILYLGKKSTSTEENEFSRTWKKSGGGKDNRPERLLELYNGKY
jgi:hypothetical protein